MLYALIIFFLTYALMLTLPKIRYVVALSSAAVFIVLGYLTLSDALSAVDWNIIMMLGGTMGVVELFIQSKAPARMSEQLLTVVPNSCWAIIALSLFSGLISAFVDNVATVLMLAPIGLAVAKKLKISPVPVVIAIAVSSNLQGAATLVGDTTSILLGSYGGLDFFDFFWMDGRPGIFWAVELGAIATVPVFLILFRKYKEPVVSEVRTKVTDPVPTFLLLGIIAGLIMASFIPNKPALTNGYICVTMLVIGIINAAVKNGGRVLTDVVRAIDFQTLLLLAGLFIVIQGVTNAGVIDAVADLFVKFGGGSLFVMYTVLVFASVLISAFIDNIPYVATMLPVVTGIASSMGVSPYILYFGLLTGATLGGNLTPIGASANVAGIGILRKSGYEVKNSDFFKIGIPFTAVAVLTGYVFIWLVWSGA